MKTAETGSRNVLAATALSLSGLAVSGILLHRHVVIQVGGDPILGGLCSITESASCDDVLASSAATFRGLPTAMWGFFFFAAMSAWYLMIGRPTGAARRLNLIPVAVTGVGTIVCIGLAVVMYTKLDRWCPYCALTHLITLSLFVASIVLWRDSRGRDSQSASSASQPVVASRSLFDVALLAVAFSVVGWSEYNRRLEAAYAQEYKSRWQEYDADYRGHYERLMASEPAEIPIEPDDPVRGKADARHTVVVFSDILCPHCARVDLILQEQVEAYPDALRVVFKHFPMNKLCNKKLSRDLHPGACEAAWTVETARLIGGETAFWTMINNLFARASELRTNKSATLETVNASMGVERNVFRNASEQPVVKERVERHVALARKLKLTGTPRLFFDGRPLTRWSDETFWRYLLRDAENAVSTQPTSQPPVQATE
jgi:protein-disulfide isomerase/uncharacterized membrane protein